VKHWLRTAKGDITVFTTYDSASKIANLFDVVIFDEAHYLTESENSKILDKVTGRGYLFTATPITKSWGMSMDDEARAGRVITEVTPKELIAGGYMVPPKLIRADIQLAGYDPKSDELSIVKPHQAIAHALVSAQKELAEEGWDGPVKLLVAMSSTQPFKTEIIDMHAEMKAIFGKELEIYTIASSGNYTTAAGVNVGDRKAVIDHMANNTKDCVIVHCDTLAEGIDVDGLNAFFPLRELSKPKFIQTYGRCARPANEDKVGIEIKPKAQRRKQTAVIIVPVINGNNTVFVNTYDWLEVLSSQGYAQITHKVYPSGETTWGVSDKDEDEIFDPKLRVASDIERFDTTEIGLFAFMED
jgi:superfamily II DNA or RNA helicase